MKSFLTFLTACFSLITLAQDLSVSSLVKFSSTHELATDSETVFIRNYSLENRSIKQVFFPTKYGSSPFSAAQLVGISIPAKDSVELKFYFHPDQNILYNQDILVGFDNGESIVVEMEGQGRFTNTYYQSTQNKEEQDLKDALKTRLAQGYISLSYNAARDNMYAQLDNVGGDVECVYTGRVATFNSRAGANSNNFNCEHTYPQSFFGSASPMVSDIHHLFPTDGSANSVRSNNPFGLVNNPTWTVGGSKYGSSVFEPRDEHKGDCARAMMYFVTRYQDYQGFFAGQEAILRQWHEDFPPTQKSIDRNNGIAALQTSRNPFVDYPQLIKRISSLANNSVAPKSYKFVEDTFPIEIKSVSSITGKALVTKAIANTGNTSFKIFGAGFSQGNHSVINFPSSDTVTLEPGDSYTFLLEIDPTSQTEDNTSFGYGILTDIVDFGGCMISWDPVLSNESLKPQTSNFEQNIFPNPSSNEFNVVLDSGLKALKVFDVLGNNQPVSVIQLQNRVVVQHTLSAGVYLVNVVTENDQFTTTLIIQ